MQITINTEVPLSDTDRALLAVLSGGDDAPAAKPTPAPAKKAAAAPEKKADEPTAEPEADDSAADDGAPVMADAVKMATELVANGQSAKVKAALGEVGAKRVSEIPEDKVAEFIAALG